MVSCLNFDVVVTNGHQVGDCILLHALLSLKERLDFPLLVVMREQLFKFCPRTNDRNIFLNLYISTR